MTEAGNAIFNFAATRYYSCIEDADIWTCTEPEEALEEWLADQDGPVAADELPWIHEAWVDLPAIADWVIEAIEECDERTCHCNPQPLDKNALKLALLDILKEDQFGFNRFAAYIPGSWGAEELRLKHNAIFEEDL